MTTDILDERGKDYGDPVVNHARIAELWTAYLGHDVTAHQVAICFILAKISRLAQSPGHLDSYVDIDGYARIAAMCAKEGQA
jgi:hypothetical protein